ncbi:MAG: hypothetical protein HOP26_08565 [Methylotenera sp.]|nr:hypothetical protein [Methylotenera sp.]MDD4926850.1 hypothetical protein [Methylotenera sp.]NOS96458.1 hypothetical protein [Methylotenera sp.]NOU40411.1 hypothetical protein [Methylotenera sp.]
MSNNDKNDDLAKAFKQAIQKPEERIRLLNNYPELKSALLFYDKNETNFIQNSSSNKYAHIILNALIENIYYQIQEDGPASFDDIAKIHLT